MTGTNGGVAASAGVAATAGVAAAAEPTFRDVTPAQWRTLAAAMLGWMFDSMDFLLYVMAIGRLQQYFGFSAATAGLLATVTLLTAAAGGLTFGIIADKIGRVRTLSLTILVYSVCSIGSATSQTVLQLAVWRALLGFGMGGEWAAGAVLVAETWPPALRNKATSLMQSTWAIGAILAAGLAGLVFDVLPLGENAWRWLFALGALPGFLAWWVRRKIEEPEVWKKNRDAGLLAGNPYRVLFGKELRKRTLLACSLSSLLLFAYWGLFTWLPNILASPVEQGGAGMSIVKSAAFIIPMQIGAFIGYLSFGPLADRFGRRQTFAAFTVTAAIIVPVYLQLMTSPVALMLMGPVLGFVGHGYWSMLGPLLSELFPTSVRASGQGLGYNSGRVLGAAAPYVMGVLAGIPGVGLIAALGLTSAFYLGAAALVFALPDSSKAPLTG
ncbi:MAG: MFS transporter [Gemmatimonadetes bacterium]|nr:MFS transporter [Gemmatimonadota bacterium]